MIAVGITAHSVLLIQFRQVVISYGRDRFSLVELGGIEPPAARVSNPTAAPSSPVSEKANISVAAGCWPFPFMTIKEHNTGVMRNTSGNYNVRVINLPQWPIYCFLSHREENVIRRWLDDERITNTQRAIFQAKIDLFERGGPDLNPGLIAGPIAKDIYKMKIKGHKGHVQLRPMLCYGPFAENEVTLLFGAIEKDFKLIPETCKASAQGNREILLADRRRRRRERID